MKVKMLVAQPCPTLWDPMDCSLPGSSVHGILQARILKWVALPFFRGSSQPRDRTQVSHIASGFFTVWATKDKFTKFSISNQHGKNTLSSLVAQTVKNLPAMWETWIQSLGLEDPLEEGMATHSSILAWRIPMDRGAAQATVNGVAKSQTWLSN